MKRTLRLATMIGVCGLLTWGRGDFCRAEERRGLDIEIEVVSRATLSISTRTSASPIGGDLKIDFGNIDAFGIQRGNGAFVEETNSGMAYYQTLTINAGITGGFGNQQNLKVSLLSAYPGSISFFEGPGPRLVPGQPPPVLRSGQTRLVVPNLSGFKSLDRVFGVLVRPETPAGGFSAQLRYSLESGG